MAETKVSIKLELDTTETVKRIDGTVANAKATKTMEIEPTTISLKDGVSEEEVLESVKNSISKLEIPEENDIPEFKKAEYKDLLIKERIKAYPFLSLETLTDLKIYLPYEKSVHKN